MTPTAPGKAAIVVTHALVGWALCGAIVGIGMAVTSEYNALVAHAIGAPIVFAITTFFYYRNFGYTGPLQTAVIFLGVVIFMDVFVVALLIERSFAMFTSFLGTWLTFILNFGATWLTGLLVRQEHPASSQA
ncbi:MAG TPA: hypothetical protein VLA28_09605 [Afifellaceae bacterium]|nr:hypothetical protein [Afifellaceae bacterium]